MTKKALGNALTICLKNKTVQCTLWVEASDKTVTCHDTDYPYPIRILVCVCACGG